MVLNYHLLFRYEWQTALRTAFWDMAPRNLIDRYQSFGVAWWLKHKGRIIGTYLTN